MKLDGYFVVNKFYLLKLFITQQMQHGIKMYINTCITHVLYFTARFMYLCMWTANGVINTTTTTTTVS